MDREKLIKDLYAEINKSRLPEGDEGTPFYYDEGTGTWYMLTGRRQIDRPNIELAKKYFEDALRPLAGLHYGDTEYQKALYLSIAVEAIDRILKQKNQDNK